ncbi:MAG TPA: hypothetical protein DEF51_34990, partial [Myxococcales bacterium]|nr:hypothetical protein [Myxococcales bacterium]
MTTEGGTFDPERVAQIASDAKLGRLDVRVAGPVVEVQRDDALVVVVPVEGLGTGALSPYTERFSVGHVGVILVGPPPEDVLARLS